MSDIILIHIFSCLVITGLIWTIQVVHYPGFKYIDSSEFQDFQAFHMKRITYVVGPLMLTEILTGGVILYIKMNAFWIINFISIMTLWIYTAVVSVPIHNSLTKNKDMLKISKLVNTNWVRTLLWSARAIVLCYILIKGVVSI